MFCSIGVEQFGLPLLRVKGCLLQYRGELEKDEVMGTALQCPCRSQPTTTAHHHTPPVEQHGRM